MTCVRHSKMDFPVSENDSRKSKRSKPKRRKSRGTHKPKRKKQNFFYESDDTTTDIISLEDVNLMR